VVFLPGLEAPILPFAGSVLNGFFASAPIMGWCHTWLVFIWFTQFALITVGIKGWVAWLALLHLIGCPLWQHLPQAWAGPSRTRHVFTAFFPSVPI
jgi:hypothetical protein